MPVHDPLREVEKLRDHLAAHDKPLALLVGAGASCAPRDPDDNPLVPPIAVLGALCEEAVGVLGEAHAEGYGAVKAEIESMRVAEGEEEPVANVEEILTSVRRKLAAMGPDDVLAGLGVDALKDVERVIRETIARAAKPDNARVPARLLHDELARWIGRIDRTWPVELFTTNYDTLLERALEAERVPFFDGFVGGREPFFAPLSLLHDEWGPGRRWARVWKIHGSITWCLAEVAGVRRIVRGPENIAGELIFPSQHKYDESRKQPYHAMLEHLQRVLTRREDVVLIVVGFSFGDQHINEVIFDALDANERMHVFALQHEDPPDAHDLVTRALRRPNLVVYGPKTAIIGGTHGEWRLSEPANGKYAALLDIPFVADQQGGEEPALTGTFRLGDFKQLAEFLRTIAGDGA